MSLTEQSPDVTIRRVGAGDAQALVAFYNGLSTESKRTFHPLGTDAYINTCDEIILANVGTNETKLDLAAVSDGSIVGWAFLWDVHTSAPTFGLAVANAWQGAGLGSKLMDAVLDEARRRAVPRIRLTVVTDNERAHRMYERRGFRTTGDHVGDDNLHYFDMELSLDHERT